MSWAINVISESIILASNDNAAVDEENDKDKDYRTMGGILADRHSTSRGRKELAHAPSPDEHLRQISRI